MLFRITLSTLPIFFIIISLSIFRILSAFIQHLVKNLPSSKSSFVRLIVNLLFETFEVTPTTTKLFCRIDQKKGMELITNPFVQS